MTEPYYSDEFVTLYLGDCIDEFQWIGADVLVTDPPYGMSYSGFGGRKGEPRRSQRTDQIRGDGSTETRDTALSLWPSDKAALVFGKWDQPRPDNVRMRLVWDKSPCGFMGDLSLPWGGAEEEIYVLGTVGFTGKREGNVIRAQTLMSNDATRPNHPTPKPIGLMEKLIAKTIGTVADPFSGSGTTLIAARNLGRKSIGVEIDERYCEITAKRLGQQTFDFGVIA